MSQHNVQAITSDIVDPMLDDCPIYERPAVEIAAKVLSALGNAIFAFGLVGVVASMIT